MDLSFLGPWAKRYPQRHDPPGQWFPLPVLPRQNWSGDVCGWVRVPCRSLERETLFGEAPTAFRKAPENAGSTRTILAWRLCQQLRALLRQNEMAFSGFGGMPQPLLPPYQLLICDSGILDPPTSPKKPAFFLAPSKKTSVVLASWTLQPAKQMRLSWLKNPPGGSLPSGTGQPPLPALTRSSGFERLEQGYPLFWTSILVGEPSQQKNR